MYAFRKPFTAAAYDPDGARTGFKAILVASQVIGYTLSKFVGIKVASETSGVRRAWVILELIVGAEAALVLFAITPSPYSAAPLFLNGLALGMVFGLVVGFLEGRRLTEAMAAGLCASFIVADGYMKTLGTSLLDWGCSEAWMPAAAGALFLPITILFIWMLTHIAPPSHRDVAERSARATLNAEGRASFLARHAAVLFPLVAMYLAVTILRSLRADFAPEIWKSLGTTTVPSIFSRSESLVAIGILVLCGSCSLIRDNRRAFEAALLLSLLGTVLIGSALTARQVLGLDAFTFMVMMGLGLYLPYVAVHTTVFERYIAITRERNNLGFLMSYADAVGYLGYVGVLLGHNALSSSRHLLASFLVAGWIAVGVSMLCLTTTWLVLRKKASLTGQDEKLVATEVA
jgi:hypothetical protein